VIALSAQTPGYLTKQEQITVHGAADLLIQSLLDREQFSDPLGAAERLGISSALWPLFGLLWPSGAHLAARIAHRPVQASERILELGCGLGLASLIAHRRGADVTASDCHPCTEEFLLENLRLNALPPMKYRHAQWGSYANVSAAQQNVSGQFELIIASDVLYERDPSGDLAGFISAHACADAEVWIVDPDRGNRSNFNRHMRDFGFALQEQRLDHQQNDTQEAYKGRMLSYTRGVVNDAALLDH
jgi:predicted nicotinamide N-methyase